MAQIRSGTRRLKRKIDRTKALSGAGRAQADQGERDRQVQRVRRRCDQPRHRAKKSDQAVRGSLVLPQGTGKSVRVAVFAQGDKARAGADAGADIVGFEDLAERDQGRQDGFRRRDRDARRDARRRAARPDPRSARPHAEPESRNGDQDVATAVKNAKAGQVQYRTDKAASSSARSAAPRSPSTRSRRTCRRWSTR